MNRLLNIETSLSAINQAAFQNMCDSFLSRRNENYSAFSRTGSQIGKQKTIKGTPDTFLLLPTGKYLLVEYSTNISAGIKKLIGDVQKCIDLKKTAIPINNIAEIILCLNYNLTAREIQTLKDILIDTEILLTIYTLDSLAIELHLHHRDLANEYLGLPIDTGQIVCIQKFINEYGRASNGISTPLDNAFLHRESELKELKEAILNNDFIILTGSPGIGKTKLALEGINLFLTENLSYVAYCVSYKHHTLLEDLYQYFHSEKDYILFVDDANRIDAFNQIIGFYRSLRKGRLKIVITIRDYAFHEISILCHEFSPKRIDLTKLSDEQITDIIKNQPFNILNTDYHTEIIRIADGNPRLAIMTALLAKAHQNINALSNISDLFENYFSTFVSDNGEFAKTLNIQCLGLISFFYTIPYRNKEITTPILNNFRIEYSDFIEAIDKLERLELLEIQYDHVKIPEQNLSTYFFFKSFIKENLLSFETLLGYYFDNNSNRFKDCVIPANNTFGYENVMSKLQPSLRNHWNSIKLNPDKSFIFLLAFWYYLQSESLEFVYNLTKSLPEVDKPDYVLGNENHTLSSSKNDVIKLLSEFLRFPDNLREVLELGFEYSKKKPELFTDWIHRLRTHLTFDREDQTQHRFSRQIILYQILLGGLEKEDSLLTAVFYELSKTFLSFSFRQTKGARNHSFIMYDFPIPHSPIILDFRQRIWIAIERNYKKNAEKSLSLLLEYSSIRPDVAKEIMQFDIPFVVEIINNHMDNSSFRYCQYVQDLIRWCKKNTVTHPEFQSLALKYTNPTYEVFLKIDWNKLRDKEMYEFDDYKEYERLKVMELRSSFLMESYSDVKQFYNTFIYLHKLEKNAWNYNTSLDIIIDENFIKKFEAGCLLLAEVMANQNESGYIPTVVFDNHLKTTAQTNRIFSLMQQFDFFNKDLWILEFCSNVDDSLLSDEYVSVLIDTIRNIKGNRTISLKGLKRFLKFEPELFQIILNIIVERNEKEGTQLQVGIDFFSSNFDLLRGDVDLIKKAYLQQEKFQNHCDFHGNGFLNILKIDTCFLLEYVENVYSEGLYDVFLAHKDMGFIWQIEWIEGVMEKVFDLVIEKEPLYGIQDHFCNAFFKNLTGTYRDKAKLFLINYCRSYFYDFRRMNLLVDILRHSFSDLFEEVLILFLSLNQDVDVFSKVHWRGTGTFGSGDVLLSDIEMADWRNILSIVETSALGIRLIPIKRFLIKQIEYCQKNSAWERQRRFINR